MKLVVSHKFSFLNLQINCRLSIFIVIAYLNFIHKKGKYYSDNDLFGNHKSLLKSVGESDRNVLFSFHSRDTEFSEIIDGCLDGVWIDGVIHVHLFCKLSC